MVLLVTGEPKESGKKTEVLDLGNLENECEDLADFPRQTKDAAGGLIQGIPVICGGLTSEDLGTEPYDDCYKYQNGDWTFLRKMSQPRRQHGSISLSNGLYILGGQSEGSSLVSPMSFQASTELIGLENNQALEDMPAENSFFCTVRVTDTTLFYSGGLGSGFVISKASYLKRSHFEQGWTRNQDMWQARLAHMCGVLNVQGKPFIVVTGGTDFNQVLKSTEIMDLSSSVYAHWVAGPDLPVPIVAGSMIASPRHDALYVLGGNQDSQERNSFNEKIFKLSCSDTDIQNCQWKEVAKKLKYLRTSHVAMKIPRNLTFCSPSN